jgi:hypothetical protein
MGILKDYYGSGYSSPFGDPRENGRTHRGQDMSHSSTPGTVGVPAVRAGRVVSKTAPSSSHGFGYGITVRSVLDDGNEWDISYSHGPWASSQQVGEQIAAGQIILHEGTSGSTNGSCCHIEQRRVSSGAYIDPAPELRKIAERDGAPAPAPAPAPAAVDGPKPAVMLSWPWWGIQRMLKGTGRYGGAIDNQPGPQTVRAFQSFVGVAQDGDFGPVTCRAAQTWLKGKWGYGGAIDAQPGPQTRDAWDRAEAANGRAFAHIG